MRSARLAATLLFLSACQFSAEPLTEDDPYAQLSHFKAQAVSPMGRIVTGGPFGVPEQAVEDALLRCEEAMEGPCKLARLGERRVGEPTAEQLKEMMADYERWMEGEARAAADSGNPQAANWIAYYYAVRGVNLEAALSYADLAAAAAPEAPAVLDTKGLVLHRLGRHQEAEPFFIKAAQGDPSAGHIKHYGDNAMAMGKLSFAEKAYERALAAGPSPMLRRLIERRMHRIRQKTGRAR